MITQLKNACFLRFFPRKVSYSTFELIKSWYFSLLCRNITLQFLMRPFSWNRQGLKTSQNYDIFRKKRANQSTCLSFGLKFQDPIRKTPGYNLSNIRCRYCYVIMGSDMVTSYDVRWYCLLHPIFVHENDRLIFYKSHHLLDQGTGFLLIYRLYRLSGFKTELFRGDHR